MLHQTGKNDSQSKEQKAFNEAVTAAINANNKTFDYKENRYVIHEQCTTYLGEHKYYVHKINECDLFLMSPPTSGDYKKLDQNHLYLYKNEKEQIFYRIQDSVFKLEIRQSIKGKKEFKFEQSEINPVKCENLEICTTVLVMTSKAGHTQINMPTNNKHRNSQNTHTSDQNKHSGNHGSIQSVTKYKKNPIDNTIDKITPQTPLVIKKLTQPDSNFCHQEAIAAREAKLHAKEISNDGYVMENAGDQNLMKYLANKNMTSLTLIKLYRILAEKLVDLHERGYAHLDIKHDNIMIDSSDNGYFPIIKLVDYGFATTHPQSNKTTGSALYAAPEVLNLNEAYDAKKADVYSLGSLFAYHFFPEIKAATLQTTKRKINAAGFVYSNEVGDIPLDPYDEKITEILDYKLKLNENPNSITNDTNNINKITEITLRPIIEKMLTIDPSKRPTAQEILADLNQLERKYLSNSDASIGEVYDMTLVLQADLKSIHRFDLICNKIVEALHTLKKLNLTQPKHLICFITRLGIQDLCTIPKNELSIDKLISHIEQRKQSLSNKISALTNLCNEYTESDSTKNTWKRYYSKQTSQRALYASKKCTCFDDYIKLNGKLQNLHKELMSKISSIDKTTNNIGKSSPFSDINHQYMFATSCISMSYLYNLSPSFTNKIEQPHLHFDDYQLKSFTHEYINAGDVLSRLKSVRNNYRQKSQK